MAANIAASVPPAPGMVTQKKSGYRWVIIAIIFLCYVVCMADRSNIGAVLPFVKKEFSISNFESGAISSFFFLGYAISQIPAGLAMTKWGTRKIVGLAILAFSIVTFFMGFTTAAVILLVLRLLLGLSEGAAPVGMTSTINAWFPRREKGTATGLYIASTQFAPIIVPPIAVAIASAWGWRWVFLTFALPGILMAIVWLVFVRSRPEESKRVNEAELTYIRHNADDDATAANFTSMGWLDKVIRLRSAPALDTNGKVLRSGNVWLNTAAYFMMNNVNYGLLTWVPSYLVVGRHMPFIKMGFIASAPAMGGLVGALIGGWVSDKLFNGRRKPTMILTAFFAAIMLVTVINAPQNTTLIFLSLFFTGFFLNVGWPMFTAYPMNLTTAKTYPFAISIINSGGNLGGFFAPMIVGALLDTFNSNYNVAFSYFVGCMILALVLVLCLVEAAPRTAAQDEARQGSLAPVK